MEIKEIIKNAFIFPSRNLETLSIFAILTLFSSAFTFEGIITIIFGIMDIQYLVIGAIYLIIAFILGMICRSISIDCIKSGVNLWEKAPSFIWWKSFGAGFSKIIVTIFYFLVPALIVVFIALITNIIGGVLTLGEGITSAIPTILLGSSAAADAALFNASLPLLISLSITVSLGLIIFLVFSFFQFMAEARLAHKGRLRDALNIVGAARDLTRIGVLKVILLCILIFVIVTIIELICAVIFDQLLVLSILTIVITPYLTLFGQNALGLLYSDIV